MADHQLSTRDLAARSDSDGPDGPLETDQPTDRTTEPNPTKEGEPDFETAQSDEPLTRDRATADDAQADTQAADGGLDPSDGGNAPAPTQSELGEPATPTAAGAREPLLPPDQSERFTNRWQEIQTSFVDQPRNAAAEADALVADLMHRLAASFSDERERLEAQWDRGDDVSTEDLRVALTRYRSFFDRLLSA